jgi:Zn-finger nucleic acid-binding protein
MLENAHCPACRKPQRLKQVDTRAAEIELYRCDKCRGIVATLQAASRIAANEPAATVVHSVHSCRRCGAGARLDALHCPTCAAPLGIQCPLCWTAMDVVRAGTVVVDVCRSCEFLFFDEGELAEACRAPAQLTGVLKLDRIEPGRSGARRRLAEASSQPTSGAETNDTLDAVAAALATVGIGGKVALGVSSMAVVAASGVGRALLHLLSTVFR